MWNILSLAMNSARSSDTWLAALRRSPGCLSPNVSSRSRVTVNYLLAEAASRAGLPPVHPHMLRHSCGFSLANRGYDLRLIQDYLGHRDPKHTVHYTRVAAGRFEGLWC